MNRKIKIILILVLLLIIAFLMFNEDYQIEHAPYKTIGNNSIGTVEKVIYGNPNSSNTIALITGIHPRETLSITPEIISAQQYVKNHDDVKIIHYKVNVTNNKLTLIKPKPFMELLKNSISNTISILTNIFGIIIFFGKASIRLLFFTVFEKLLTISPLS